eukprot:TRINITY_DN14755_c0_g1_i1.p1 TRINITY_DN14755_c0_g1~~TRINITY_DN14755_c0_g1_i1.p1  ORF type:complete len:420 (+),score=68.69 TRINITY_DN14755_c0_g1_i1:208-1467(+)
MAHHHFFAPRLGSADSVQVLASTWTRDSHDLFDFEVTRDQLHTRSFTVQRSLRCIRQGMDVQVVGEDTPTDPGWDTLARVVHKEGAFFLDSPRDSKAKKLWLVVRDLQDSPPKGHRLTEGDLIKLGRFKFRVRQMVNSSIGGKPPELHLDDGTTCEALAYEDEKFECRICFTGGSEENPLVAPCQCKGSITHVHLECLRHWIAASRLDMMGGEGGSFLYRPVPCELCKAVYPTYVKVKEERVPLVEVPKTVPPFIVLENLVRDSQYYSGRGLHVISLYDKEFLRIGRGHESDVRIADVSISRCHATIGFDDGRFVLEDTNSKFGTLVALRRPRRLCYDRPVSIQIGRTVLSMNLQPHPNSVPIGPIGSEHDDHLSEEEALPRFGLGLQSPRDGEPALGSGGSGGGIRDGPTDARQNSPS